MVHNKMRKPLIQSGLVIIIILLLIGYVANSDATTILGSIAAILRGIFYTILFPFALLIALTISLAILIGLGLIGIALYSPAKSKNMLTYTIGKIRTSYSSFFARICPNKTVCPITRTPQNIQSQEIRDLKIQISTKNEYLETQREALEHALKKIAELESIIEQNQIKKKY